jgi:hypothetical protein
MQSIGANPLVKEACEWIVEHGQSASNEGVLSEGAYLEMCNLAQAKYAHTELLSTHQELLSTHQKLLLSHGNLQDAHLEVLGQNQQHLIRKNELLKENQQHLIRETDLLKQIGKHLMLKEKALEAKSARYQLLAKCISELSRLDAWTDELKELYDRDKEARKEEAKEVEMADQGDAAQPRRPKRKRGEAGAAAEA